MPMNGEAVNPPSAITIVSRNIIILAVSLAFFQGVHFGFHAGHAFKSTLALILRFFLRGLPLSLLVFLGFLASGLGFST
jgi:hypothetical protein